MKGTGKRNISRVSILWATVENAPALATCHSLLFAEPWDEASFARLLSHPGSTSLVARSAEPQEVIGFIVGQLAADEAEILTFGVRPDWQRSGLGRRLLEGLMRAAKRGEARRLFLEVAADNVPATALYARSGFRESGRRTGYYKRAGSEAVDALALSLAL